MIFFRLFVEIDDSAAKRHSDLPTDFILPDSVASRWTWLPLTARLAAAFGWAKFYQKPEVAEKGLGKCDAAEKERMLPPPPLLLNSSLRSNRLPLSCCDDTEADFTGWASSVASSPRGTQSPRGSVSSGKANSISSILIDTADSRLLSPNLISVSPSQSHTRAASRTPSVCTCARIPGLKMHKQQMLWQLQSVG